MKIYAHIETTKPCTLIVHTTPQTTIDELKNEILKRYETKVGKQILPKDVLIHTKYRKPLEGNRKVQHFFEDADDAFVVLNKMPEPVKPKKQPVKTATRINVQDLRLLMDQGSKEIAKKHFRTASNCYEKVLESLPTHKDALIQLMDLWRNVDRPQVAEEWYNIALHHYSTDLDVVIAAGKHKHATKDYETSIQLFNKALDMMKKEDQGMHKVKDVQILAANSMYSLGGVWENPAIQLVMSVVEPERSHFGGLLLYARIAYNRELIQDAVRVLLRLSVQQETNEEVKELFADCFEDEDSVDILLEELRTGENLGSACAFLASRLKDYSEIESAIKLYEKALEVEPENPSIALNYIHTLELVLQMDKALEVAKGFLNKCQISLIKHLKNKEISRVLDGIPSYSKNGNTGWFRIEEWNPKPQKEDIEEIVEEVKYTDIQLDLLASMFTVIKMLFVGGALERAYQTVELVSTCCKATKIPLHKTLIRNEAAYFNCIMQILDQFPPSPSVPNEPNEVLYLCGDSHCLSGAWQRVEFKGKEHLLVPKLVTGCKVWHLRKPSRFYPKIGFTETVKSIPKNSSVILLFGEIDCREGISLAVEKCKYDSQMEAIKTTVSIYIQVIEDLIRKYNFQIYVHPVPPVLDITRPIVKAYNQALKKAVLDARKQKKAVVGKLFWLDFSDQLLSEDGQHLNPEFAFDDTHLSPIYTKYLQEALLQCK